MSGIAIAVTAVTVRALVLGFAAPSPLAEPQMDARSAITVDVEASVADRETLTTRLASEVSRLTEVVPLDLDRPLHLSIEGELLDFKVTVIDGDESFARPCLCTHDELVTHVLRQVVAERRVVPSPVVVSCVSPSRPPMCVPPRVVPDSTPVVGSSRSPRWRTGMALTVLGAATSGAGAGVWLGSAVGRSDFTRSSPDLRPYAIAALASGVAALTVGVALLLTRPRHRRTRARAHLSFSDRRRADRLSVLR